MNKYVVDRVLDEVKARSSYDPIKSSELEMRYALTGAEVREIIREHGRRQRYMLIVSGQRGYYLASNYKEYKEAMHHFEARAISIWHTAKILRDKYEGSKNQEEIFNP